jgi:peptide/nickel transport system substrate-binding protein
MKAGNEVDNVRRNILKAGLIGGAAAMVGVSGLGTAFAKGKDQIIIGVSQEPTNFHPLRPSIEVDQGVQWQLFSPLWGVDDKGNFTPDLATEVPSLQNGGISEDGLTWTVKLRSDVKWHDGQTFTAEDVKYTLDLLRNPDFQAGTRNGHEAITSISIVSPTEIKWVMKNRVAPYFAILAWTFIVPKHVLEKDSDVNSKSFSAKPIGTGPFKWQSRTPGDQISLVAYPEYHQGKPAVGAVYFKYVPDLVVLATQFQTGTIDHISIEGIQPDRLEEAKKYPGKQIYIGSQPNVETITLNLERPVFKDLAVRQALYMSMDKKGILETIYYGIPKSAESYLPIEARDHNSNLPEHVYDTDGASKLLEDAGWVMQSDGIRKKGDVRLEFSLQATAGNQIREQLQQFLQQSWLAIGVDVKLVTLPPAVLWADNWVFSKFDAIVAGTAFMAGPDADTTTYFDSHSIPAQGGSGLNNFQYKNPEVDKILAEARETIDAAARTKLYLKQQEIIRRDLPFLPIYHKPSIEGTDAALVGYLNNVNVLSNCWNVRNWRWN